MKHFYFRFLFTCIVSFKLNHAILEAVSLGKDISFIGQSLIVATCHSFDVFIKHTLSVGDYMSSFSWPHLSAWSQCPIYPKQLSWTETFLDYVIIEICMYPVINILSLMCKYWNWWCNQKCSLVNPYRQMSLVALKVLYVIWEVTHVLNMQITLYLMHGHFVSIYFIVHCTGKRQLK